MTPFIYSEKNFFAKDFSVSLTFHNKGGVSGVLSHFSNNLTFQKEFTGLYSVDDSKLKLAFIVEWTDSNLSSQTLTTFSGTIFSYEKEDECLILRWLKNEAFGKIGTTMEQDFELLFSCSEKDPYAETKKILLTILEQSSFADLFHRSKQNTGITETFSLN